MLLLIKWLCAHLLGDFALQTTRIVQHKRRRKAGSGYLYLHCLIHGALIYLFDVFLRPSLMIFAPKTVRPLGNPIDCVPIVGHRLRDCGRTTTISHNSGSIDILG